jgi:glycosyltransferase involved in cell wall biosynthesis
LPEPSDIALVSLGTTAGLRSSDEAFARVIRGAGASCRIVRVRLGAAGRLRRQIAVTDLVEAIAARRAAREPAARAVVFSTVTAAFLQRPDVPYAVRFDAPAAMNRRGLSGAWQRAREPRTLRAADLLIALSEEAARGAGVEASERLVVMPIPVEEVDGASERDIDAVAFAGSPRKRGLELFCRAWRDAAPGGARLVVGGVEPERALAWLERQGVEPPPGIEWAGDLPRERWLETVGRARLFVNASRWEDFGLAQLEALSAGTALATVPSPGAYEALKLARTLDPDLVADDMSPPALAAALRAGLAMDASRRSDYALRAAELLEPYRPAALARAAAERVLPALGLR